MILGLMVGQILMADGQDSEYISRINGNIHESHLNPEGGLIVGAMAIEELHKAVPELAPYLEQDVKEEKTR